MREITKEPVTDGLGVAKYVAKLTPQKLEADVMGLTHDIQQLSSMMGECMKQSMPTVVVADITVHVEMKMGDKLLFSAQLGHVSEMRGEEKQG